ncbi:MAG: LysR family transcriptional regulator [Oscillospiraceae bacterium]|nr:LysR family transcriptional regulator [Oscillospiraceae bacterium]
MTFNHLSYFIAVCDHGSIQSASKELFVSPQGIGKAIQQLESTLGVTLLKRTQTGVVPTQFGWQFYKQAKCVEHEMQKLYSLTDEYKLMKKTKIKIGILGHQKFFYGINSCIGAFMRENPDTVMELSAQIFDNSDKLIGSVHIGEMDVGWMFHWRDCPEFKYYSISDYSPIQVLISREHPLASKTTVTWGDCSELRYVTAGEEDPFSDLIKDLSISHGFTPSIEIYTTENNLIAQMIDNGAVAIMVRQCYYMAIKKFCRNAVVLPLEPELKIANSLFIKKENYKNRELCTFMEYMQNYFRTMEFGAEHS